MSTNGEVAAAKPTLTATTDWIGCNLCHLSIINVCKWTNTVSFSWAVHEVD